MYNSFERKGLHSTATGTVDDIDAISLIGCISVLEVFRLNRTVVCYRHRLPLHDFRRLVLHAIFSECWQRFASPLEMGLHKYFTNVFCKLESSVTARVRNCSKRRWIRMQNWQKDSLVCVILVSSLHICSGVSLYSTKITRFICSIGRV